MQDEKIPTHPRFDCCSVKSELLKTTKNEKQKGDVTGEAKGRKREFGDTATLEE
jgi:hypothetical protein